MLSQAECRVFLKAYHDGIMAKGLLQPLAEFAKTNQSRAALTAQSWYELQLAGETPQASVFKVIPAFPAPVEQLLALGFETSSLDLAIADLLEAINKNATDLQYSALIEKYRKFDMQKICADCWHSEISKILMRAKIEGATKVVLEQEGESFLHQKYVGSKLVKISEASIPAVARTIEYTLQERAKSKSDLKLQDGKYLVNQIDSDTYMLLGAHQNLEISFVRN
jgi:hypothetical protein